MRITPVVLFLIASVVLYSLALSTSYSAGQTPYISAVLIALGWNVLNTFVTTIFGVYIDPRFSILPMKEKLVFALIIGMTVCIGLMARYLEAALEKTQIPVS